ncbi:hypothetical protein KP509_07G057700 [Ceratopteris richardii]|uniref:RING-type E3 ubiquitin transferase n=1 Tax=Ceratopteris richardii TaxID=49495 RepID=A0A8T2ULK5_CERRI|nr:hypothetical protein KP509_07G057700 [Ceratopteris richardii]
MYYYAQQFPRRLLLQETATSILASSPTSASDNNGRQLPADAFNFVTPFNPTMAIVFIVLLAAFFFIAFFSIYVKRHSIRAEDAAWGRGGANQGRPNEPPSQGVDPALLEKLPLVIYSSSKKKGSNVECVVCLTDFEEGETLCQLPKCRHVFHKDCIDMWLFSHTTCPLCRRSLMSGSTRSFRWGSGSGSLRLSLARRGSQRGSAAGTGPTTPIDGRATLDNETEMANLDRVRRNRLRRSHSTGHSLVMYAQRIDGSAAITEHPDVEETRSSDSDSGDGGGSLPSFRRSRSYAAVGGEAASTYTGISSWMRGAGASFKRALSIKKVNPAATSSLSATADAAVSFHRLGVALW